MVPQRNKEKGTHKNMGKQMSSRTHYYGLDWLRGISAVCILLYHYTYRFCEHEVFSPGGGVSHGLDSNTVVVRLLLFSY